HLASTQARRPHGPQSRDRRADPDQGQPQGSVSRHQGTQDGDLTPSSVRRAKPRRDAGGVFVCGLSAPPQDSADSPTKSVSSCLVVSGAMNRNNGASSRNEAASSGKPAAMECEVAIQPRMAGASEPTATPKVYAAPTAVPRI